MKKLFVTLMCIMGVLGISFAQDVKMDAPINPDPHVKIGKLDNGLTYYIRHNETPKNRVELRLAVNAGSNQENDNQRGLAHFCEHMAFNGMEGFPGNAMVDELQRMGVVFGADLNAYTIFDETVYMIPVPLDNPNNLDVGLRILRGWANGLLFDNKEIDAERGVITEEYRMGLGASDRLQKQYWPVLMKDSRYAERLTIGDINIIQNFEYQVIKDFYHDWYRPDLQAVIVVGDIDVAQVEAKIKALFSNIQMPANPRKKENYTIPGNKEPLVAICTDKEAPGNQVMLIRKHPHFLMKNLGDFRKQLVIDLYNEMYDSRLSEMSQDVKTPFLVGSAGYSHFIGPLDIYGSSASCKENKILESINALMKEENRVLKFGFLQTELDRAKEAIMEQYERAANEVDKTESSQFVGEYVENFLRHEPIPGAKREYNYAKKFMESITLDEVNALAKEWIKMDDFVAIVIAPDKEGVNVPTKEQVLAAITDKNNENVIPYVDNYKDQEIVEKSTLTPGTIKSTEEIPAINAKKVTLSNGIEVYLKKTDFKNDEILFSAFSKGGLSLYSEKDLPSANFATEFIDRSGISELDYNTLMKKMKSKQAGVTPSINDMSETFSGSSTPKDLEFFFQYLHAFFASPRVDQNSYELVMNETKEQIKMLQANPMYKFIGALLDASTNHDPYKKNMLTFDENYLEQVDFDRAVQIYKERFANPADFTFLFVGNYDEKTMNDYLCTYLGSLKTSGKKEGANMSVFKKPAPGISKEKVVAGSEKQGWMGYISEQPYDYNEKNNMIINEIGDALEIYLIKIVREKMGDVYSPMLQMGYEKYPDPNMTLMIMLSCDPDKIDKLGDACNKILTDFQKKGPDAKTLEKVKKQLISTREKNIQTNNFWLNYINGKLYNGDDLTAVNRYNDLVNSVTKKDIVNFMKKYYKLDQYIRVDLYPENQ